MLRQPVMVMTAAAAKLASIRTKVMGRGIATAIYTEELFSTGHDGGKGLRVGAEPGREHQTALPLGAHIGARNSEIRFSAEASSE